MKLHSKQVITQFLCFLGTATDESREIVFPIHPVYHPPSIVGNTIVAFVVDVVRKCSVVSSISETAQRLEQYTAPFRILAKVGG